MLGANLNHTEKDKPNLIRALIGLDLLREQIRYGVFIPERVDAILKEFPDIHSPRLFPSGQARLELITQYDSVNLKGDIFS